MSSVIPPSSEGSMSTSASSSHHRTAVRRWPILTSLGSHVSIPGSEYWSFEGPRAMEMGQDPSCSCDSEWHMVQWVSEQKGPEPSVTTSGSLDKATDEAVLGSFVSHPSSMEYTECPISLCNSLCSLSQGPSSVEYTECPISLCNSVFSLTGRLHYG